MRELPFTSDPDSEVMGWFFPDGSTVVFGSLPEEEWGHRSPEGAPYRAR
jgi:hypothetical protein